MASRQEIVDLILEQMAGAGQVSAKEMSGEYGLYCDGKMIGMVCDDQLFIKPTAGGRAHIGVATEAPPYPGAKPCFLIAGDLWEDGDWLAALARISAAELSAAAKKRRKTKGKASFRL